jgi:hypothetical protein
MTDSTRFIRAICGSVAVVGCAVIGVTVLSATYSGGISVVSISQAEAKQNFSSLGGQCKIGGINLNLKGLAIDRATDRASARQCICPSRKAYERLLRKYPNAASLNCIVDEGQQITNFNQTSTTTSTSSTSGPGNPGNHKPVGNAGEGPPGGREANFGCCGPGTTTDHTGATGPTGGDQGASDN